MFPTGEIKADTQGIWGSSADGTSPAAQPGCGGETPGARDDCAVFPGDHTSQHELSEEKPLEAAPQHTPSTFTGPLAGNATANTDKFLPSGQ